MNFVNQTFIIAMMMMATFVKVSGDDPWIVDMPKECQTLCLSEFDADDEYDGFNAFLSKLIQDIGNSDLKLEAQECASGLLTTCIPNGVGEKASQELVEALDPAYDAEFAKTIGWCGEDLQKKCAQEANDLAEATPVPTGAPTPKSDASTLYPAFIGLLSSMFAFILFV